MPEARVTLDPKSTPGFIHASELTAESANAAVRALQSSRDYDIFTSDEPVQPGEPQEDASEIERLGVDEVLQKISRRRQRGESWDLDKEFKSPTEEPWHDRAWGRTGKNLAAISGRYQVHPGEDLERAAAEVINTSIYVTRAAMHPPHEFRVHLFILHVANASFWLQAFLQRASISRALKAWMVEDTGRLLTFMAAGVGMSALHHGETHTTISNEDTWGDAMRELRFPCGLSIHYQSCS
ncbi:hypothetical protein MAP00_000300 [Monascus purpureus]|nr:hypothetical protein MAP00_000300 [Monascus purpureus]